MKKFLIILAIIMSLSIVGCGSKDSETTSTDNTQSSAEQTTQADVDEISSEAAADPSKDEASSETAADPSKDEVSSETAADPSNDEASSEAVTDFSKYAGKYLCVKMVYSDGRDDSDLLKSQWEDKSHYSYYEITEDGNVTLFGVDGEEKTAIYTLTMAPFDEETFTLSDGEQFTFEDGKMVFKNGDGAETVWEKTDEIPE